MTSDILIKIDNVRKTYAGNFEALKGVNLEIKRGEILALLGPNGAGKTTLINAICGVVFPTSGSITVDGFDVIKDFRKTRSMIGLVPQELQLETFEQVFQNVAFTRGLYGKRANPEIIEKILKDLSLWDKRDNKLRELSGGMKRRALIAKALSHEPKILFLDEPTAGVDIELRREMWSFLKEINTNGTTIILTTHYLEEAEQLCRNIGIIDQGEIVIDTSMKNLLSKLDVQGFVLDLEEPLDEAPAIDNYSLRLDDPLTLVTAINKDSSINNLFNELNKLNIKVKSMRNESNRLEELFIEMIKK